MSEFGRIVRLTLDGWLADECGDALLKQVND